MYLEFVEPHANALEAREAEVGVALAKSVDGVQPVPEPQRVLDEPLGRGEGKWRRGGGGGKWRGAMKSRWPPAQIGAPHMKHASLADGATGSKVDWHTEADAGVGG